MFKKLALGVIALLLMVACVSKKATKKEGLSLLKISENGRFMEDESGDPFFWLGDTGWLLFSKMTREEADQYLTNRAELGFNVIQVMVLHTIGAKNVYGDSALIKNNVAFPLITEGNDFKDSVQYDFWDNVDYVVDLAAEKGLYMAMVPVWGNNVKDGYVSRDEAATYSKWLANRYKDRTNIIWLNGGDTFGSDSTATWNIIGNGLNDTDPNHLITFHPRGRCSSTDWFHNEKWMDFNMVQSGHRRYDQDDTERAYGQDNWRYMEDDYKMTPAKPTIDGEPSYEGIPQGLHDTNQPFWNDDDVRRYAYWSVFAGAFGYTYGHSAVMQFYSEKDKEPAYGAKLYWQQAVNEPGAKQMKYVKQLMLSRDFFSRVPDQSLLAENGEKYSYKVATKGNCYAMIYTYIGDEIAVNMDQFSSSKVKASWFNPRNGEIKEIKEVSNTGVARFDAPGETEEGNDWVLILDEV
ncbi:glycoside hydrolase family 140 protein [Plebeiibacterium sediminum]|uniref:Glycoside hydrolase family 140 protein n=1 Tax=Plebeiibacterium sediminum TaxID=2992112 RepID=A0AAE3M2V8_9BACT|nr:glycoside hydrolase family 140 protein [Plebeiobacterium sediminum]MCW3785961.1 glycoside hydrolase family 140 protein [Plebeiobacterium sediminum]